jgi:hypothetical protein
MSITELLEKIAKRTPEEATVFLHEADDGTYIATPALASDGVQDSDEKQTAAVDTYITVFQATLTGPADELKRQMKGLYVSIESFLKAGNATADVILLISAKNHSASSWVNIMSAATYANINTTYLSKPFTGHIRPQANLDEWPIDVRIQIKSDELNQGYGKVRNTSFVTARFK